MVATMSIAMDALDESSRAPEGAARPALALPRVHLASQSPRRRLLLAQHGIEHVASHPGVDDGCLVRGGVSPAEWVAALAYFKAAATMHRLGEWSYAPGELVIVGADTVVWKPAGRAALSASAGQIIGQPNDAPDAERIIRLLENGEHEVLTGVALVDAGTGRRDMLVDRARVRVGVLGEDRIGAYIAGGQWRGKAGAYNLRERLDDGWPIEFDGDPTTIMGLPMTKLRRRLAEFADACSRLAMS